MKTETLHLKDAYPFLGENGCDPTVDIYLPYNMTEMHREKQKAPLHDSLPRRRLRDVQSA